jgi:hypothetical protein
METDTEWGNVNEEMQLKHHQKKGAKRIKDFDKKVPPQPDVGSQVW